jgi:hypothetical protein
VMRRALLPALALFAAGCGGGGTEADPADDPEAGLRAMHDEYNSALADGDWEQACSRIAPEFIYLQRQEMQSNGVANPPEECAAMWEVSIEQGVTDPDLLRDATEDARYDGADITGKTARVDSSQFLEDSDRVPISIYARRDDDGRWKITRISN